MIYLHLHTNGDLCCDDSRRLADAPADLGCDHIEAVPEAAVQVALDALPAPHAGLTWEPGLLARLGFAAEVLADGTLKLIPPPPQPDEAGGAGDAGNPDAAARAAGSSAPDADDAAAGGDTDPDTADSAGADTTEDTQNG